MNENVNMIWVVLELAKEQVMEWATKKQSKRGCANNMSINGEGHVTYVHVKVLCTAKST